jgi:hypothetical protein
MQGAALGVDQLDRLRHRVGIFPAVLHGFEAQAGAVPMRVLRTLVGRHHRKFTGAAEPGFNPDWWRWNGGIPLSTKVSSI